MKYYNNSIEEVLYHLNVVKEKGLSEDEVEKRRSNYGNNEFTPPKTSTFFDNLLENLGQPMIIILMIAALISAIIGEIHDAIGIIGAIWIGIGIGMATEGKSKKAAQALSKLTENIEVKVLRDNKIIKISKNELVPGDIVYIETGDMIPADGRLIESVNLKIREDALTGESEEVNKKSESIINKENPIPANQINMAFCGTFVSYGRGTMVITSIGDNTQMGEIAQNIVHTNQETPLQLKIKILCKKIAQISSDVAALLFIFMIAQLLFNHKLQIDTTSVKSFLISIEPLKDAFTVCVALMVAAVPEGLPTMINMTLAITMQKMAKINALVRKKEACETIGSISVICSDKTGTLTENRMVVEVAFVDGDYLYDPSYKSSSYFEKNCIVNSTADIERSKEGVKYIGSATECALLLYNEQLDYRKIRKESVLVSQNPFSSELKRMSSIIRDESGDIVLAKGAPEILLEKCTYIQSGEKVIKLTEDKKKYILGEIQKLQEKSMRTLGFAYKPLSSAYREVALASESNRLYRGCVESELVFSGFVGIKDPIRSDVDESIKEAKNAGILVKMLTGDNIHTAKAIGRDLGLIEGNMRAVESSYIDSLSDKELKEELPNIAIVARSKPDTKMRIVSNLQELGEVVAVTGDGINDAPALSKADVGIAMGISGSEVSKNAADIILTDDSFSTIVKGIKWGRGIYDNFQRFIQFQLTVNVVAFMIAIASQILGFEMPFTTIQLLWVNIIMDGPPALSLGLEPVRRNVLNRPPVNRKASIITRPMAATIIFNSIIITTIILAQLKFNILGASELEQSTVVFTLFAFTALFNAFNCREFRTDSIFPNLFKNKLAINIIVLTGVFQVVFTQVFKEFFNCVNLSLIMWLKILFLAVLVIIINEIVKLMLRKIKHR